MKKIILTTLATIAALSISCGTKKEPPMCGKVKFLTGTVFFNSQPANLKSEACSETLVETKINSAVVIQFTDSAVITIKQNSKLHILKLKKADPHKTYVNIVQREGSTFSNVQRNKSDYFIKTPTVVAGVRGTAFETSVTPNGNTEIKMLYGKVSLRRPQEKISRTGNEFTYVIAGEKILVNSTRIETPEKITSEERDALFVMSQIDTQTRSISRTAVTNLVKNSETIKIPKQKTYAKALTEEDIKRLYGRVSVIEMKNGYQHIGWFKQEGDKMLIYSTKGNFYVKVMDVFKITPR